MNFLEQLSPLCPEAGDLLQVQTGEGGWRRRRVRMKMEKWGFPDFVYFERIILVLYGRIGTKGS